MQGRDGGGRHHGGGRGRGEPNIPPSELRACTTNILKAELNNIVQDPKVACHQQAEVTEGFHFYEFSINAQDSSGEVIESRRRRAFLFNLGLWEGVLRDLPRQDKNHLRKVVFFNGSTFYSGRQIPGLEAANLPHEMDFGERGAEGDTMQIVGVRKLLAPVELQVERNEENPNEIRFDNRTADGTRSFQDSQALLQHS